MQALERTSCRKGTNHGCRFSFRFHYEGKQRATGGSNTHVGKGYRGHEAEKRDRADDLVTRVEHDRAHDLRAVSPPKAGSKGR